MFLLTQGMARRADRILVLVFFSFTLSFMLCRTLVFLEFGLTGSRIPNGVDHGMKGFGSKRVADGHVAQAFRVAWGSCGMLQGRSISGKQKAGEREIGRGS